MSKPRGQRPSQPFHCGLQTPVPPEAGSSGAFPSFPEGSCSNIFRFTSLALLCLAACSLAHAAAAQVNSFSSSATNTVGLWANGTEYLHVTGTGNVGIGNTSPTNILSVGPSGNVGQTSAYIQARNAGNSFEWGHGNPAGYASTERHGSMLAVNNPFLNSSYHVVALARRERYRQHHSKNNDRSSREQRFYGMSDLSWRSIFATVPAASADIWDPIWHFRCHHWRQRTFGIGTASPQTPLHIYGGAGTTQELILGQGGNTGERGQSPLAMNLQ